MITFKLVKAPIVYDPLSPKKIFAFGKLNNKNDKRIITWEIIKIENSKFSLIIFKWASITLIIIKFKANKPLNPSIRFAPLIINKKHNKINNEENIWFIIIEDKKGISIFKIFMGKV